MLGKWIMLAVICFPAEWPLRHLHNCQGLLGWGHMSPFDVASWNFLTRFSTNLNLPCKQTLAKARLKLRRLAIPTQLGWQEILPKTLWHCLRDLWPYALIPIQASGWYPFLRMTLLRCYETTTNFGWLLYDLCSCRNSYIPLASSKIFNSTDSICSFGLAKRLGTETWISTAFVAKNSYGYIPGNFNFTRLSGNRLVGV